MKNRHIERVWLAQAFADDLVLVYPVYAIMMLDQGVGAFDLTVLFVIWSASSLVFEIPSGVVGDLVDRRVYLFAGSLIRASGYLTWWLLPTFPGFAFGFLLWSLGSAIHSGTLQSLLYDVLAEQGRTADFTRIYGRGQALNTLGVLVAMALGGFVAESGYTAVLLLSAVAPVASGALIAGCVREPARTHVEKGESSPTFSTTLVSAVLALRQNRSLRRVSIMFVGLVALFGTIDEFPGALLEDLNQGPAQGMLSLGVIGVLYGAFLGSQSIGAALAHRFRVMPARRIAMVSLLAHGILLGGLAAGMWAGWPGGGVLLCVGVAAYFGIMGVVEVLLETSLQHEIDSGARATITSVSGAAMELCAIVLYLVIGATAATAGWSAALAVVAMIAVLLSLAFAYSAPTAARSRS
ncbi:MAG: MFS transporter [Pseudomonadales bacterium]